MLLNEVMDDLLKRADQVIRECAITRERARHGLDQARANVEGVRAALRLVRYEMERPRGVIRENPMERKV
ncbi:hypothetical protein QA635_09065 [Bradyrhizobium brasilense]|uniref:hypothetical protein n=1 Tax=Bradyrhizobium brasilense TaxID=1419277 RepID=UPI0024B20F95|nr:hypothetical protein [Bradyrhizobium australafricanum]WFU34530.1 hypothetical protein QA635_09065 [Bradyrhizobium australafricanum]